MTLTVYLLTRGHERHVHVIRHHAPHLHLPGKDDVLLTADPARLSAADSVGRYEPVVEPRAVPDSRGVGG